MGLDLARTSTPTPVRAYAGGFLELDARVGTGAPGMVVVHAPSGCVRSLLEHLARRVELAGYRVCVCPRGPGAPAFHIAARSLRVNLAFDPQNLAEELDAAAQRTCTTLLVSLPVEGSWDWLVLTEIASRANSPVVVVTDEGATFPGAEVFEVSATLDEPARRCLWATAVEHQLRQPERHSSDSLFERAGHIAVKRQEATSVRASELAANLALVGMPWPESRVSLLFASAQDTDIAAAVEELCESARVVRRDGMLATLDTTAVPSEELEFGARALLAVYPDDGWARGRAAELLVQTDPLRADRLHSEALDQLTDPLAKQELRERWVSLVRDDQELLLRASHRALDADEPGEALRCAQASARGGPRADHWLALGRASMGLGDLIGAKLAFDAASEQDSGVLIAEIAMERSELHYARGEFGAAIERAHVAASGAPQVALRASNLVGKVRLAEGNWDAADAHFANDAIVANNLGLVREVLRARLNRAIAVLSRGLLDEATTMLRAVHDDARVVCDPRASAHALTNLAVVAWTRHDYGGALEYLERTFAQRRALATASMRHVVASLAELRLRLGLYEHAMHTICFGRRGTMSPAAASQYAVVAARIALANGDSLTARREIQSAIDDASGASDPEWLGEVRRLAARVALEDGDVAGCRAELAKADASGMTERARAEYALLVAQVSRASGVFDSTAANTALLHARMAGDEELLCEALYLLAVAHEAEGSAVLARELCEQACAIRTRVADGLRTEVRMAFLAKPESLALSRLQASLSFATESSVAHESRRPRASTPHVHCREIAGEDPAIRALVASIRRVARSNATVLIRGESGTGKELVADALHRASDRAAGPLVSVNCAALVEGLLLSELFGHEKGAFTGATSRRNGRFELAEGGTLFLDEIGDISPQTQVALLRVLQERTFERVGGTVPVHVDVRIVCATHRDLRAMVERGEFREDLYYRVRGIQLDVPPLRARLGDLGRLCDVLLARIGRERGESPKTVSRDAIALLRRHTWPGNVRELENALRAASLFTNSDLIEVCGLLESVEELRHVGRSASGAPFPSIGQPTARRSGSGASRELRVEWPAERWGSRELCDSAGTELAEEPTAVVYAQVRQGAVSLTEMKRHIERDCIARALVETEGNITKAATLLGMKRPRLSQLVKQYGLLATTEE